MDKQQNSDQQTLKRKPKRRHPILRTLTVILLVALFLGWRICRPILFTSQKGGCENI